MGRKKGELVDKVSHFIDGLNISSYEDGLIFCIVKESEDSGLMRFEGKNTSLAGRLADFAFQQPELAKCMVAALYANSYCDEDGANAMIENINNKINELQG